MPAPTSSERLNRRNVVFTFFLGLSWALFSRPLVRLFQSAWATDEYTHILLVLPVSLALIFLETRNLKLKPAFAPWAAFPLFALSATAWGVAYLERAAFDPGIALAFLTLSLVSFWLASVIACYGIQVFKAFLFPLWFLFLLVPLPSFLLDKAVVFLQQASTAATFVLFKLSGTPVMRDGFVLSLPSLQIEVAKQCSGIRSSEMLLITGLILAHLFLRKVWSKVAFVAFIVPMAIAKNAIRIFTLAMLGIHVNPDFLEGKLHHEGGGVFFAIALAALLAAIWILQRLESRSRGTKSTPAGVVISRTV